MDAARACDGGTTPHARKWNLWGLVRVVQSVRLKTGLGLFDLFEQIASDSPLVQFRYGFLPTLRPACCVGDSILVVLVPTRTRSQLTPFRTRQWSVCNCPGFLRHAKTNQAVILCRPLTVSTPTRAQSEKVTGGRRRLAYICAQILRGGGFVNAKTWPAHGGTRPGIVLPTPAHLVHVGIWITGNLLWADTKPPRARPGYPSRARGLQSPTDGPGGGGGCGQRGEGGGMGQAEGSACKVC